MDGGKQNPENQSSDQQTNSWNRFSPGPLLDQQAGQAGSMNCDCNQVHGHKSNFIMNAMRKTGAHPASCSWSQIKFIHKIIMNEMRKTGARSPCLLDGV